MSSAGANQIWQDREIRFDEPVAHLRPRKGEFEIDSMNSVEDTKGALALTLALCLLTHGVLRSARPVLHAPSSCPGEGG